MKKILVLLFVNLSLVVNAQIITTVIGNGIHGNTIDGAPATSSAIGEPDGCAFDTKGNFYFTQVSPNIVYKVTPSGIISTIAGTVSSGYNGDGIAATSAELAQPSGIAVDNIGNIYIADGINNRVRRVDMTTGIITTIAGNGTFGFGGDGGAATAAVFNGIEDICFDKSGNLYISDVSNCRIRKVNTSGIITTFAGTGTCGFSGDGGMATSAEIQGVFGICTDKIGNLYISQNLDSRIRKVNTLGIITTIAGNGLMAPSGDNGPATAAALGMVRLVCDNYGDLYISGYVENDIRVIDKWGFIHTIAGTGVYGFSGDNGQATAAQLSSTYGIALDTCGNVYVADKDNYRIRKIALNPTCINEEANTIKKDETIHIYPNPAIDELNINNLTTECTYQLLSIVGAVMQQGTLKAGNNSISIQAIPNGMYLLEVSPVIVSSSNQGAEKTITKIVKQ